MGDTNRVALRIVPEATPGITPATPAFQQLRITGTPNLAFEPNTITTNEIRPDRQITDLILVGASAAGDAGFELSALSLDTIIEGGFLTAWARRNNRTGANITDISSDVITVNTGVAFAANDLIALNGFGDLNDDLVFPAVATTDATTVTAASGLVDNASPAVSASVRNVGVQSAAGDVDAAVSPNRLTSTVLDFTTLGITAGQWLKLGGTANLTGFLATANNAWVRVAGTPTTNEILFDVVPSGWGAEANVAQTVWLQLGDYAVNGTTLTQYTLEREFSDIAVFEYFTGMAVNTLKFALTQQDIVTAVASFLGFSSSIGGTRFTGATTVAASDETVVNTSSNVGRIARGGTPITGLNFVLDATIDIDNGLRQRNAVGSLGAIGVGVGEFSVTGTLNTYFDDASLINEVINNTETSLDFRFDGATSIATTKRPVIIDLPRVKYSSGAPSVPGKNQDTLQSLSYRALRHANLGYTVMIQQFHGVQIT